MHLSHLLRTDVRQFALLLVAWLLIQLMSTVYASIQPFIEAESRMAVALAALGLVLAVARWLGLAVLVPLVMHTHPAVGSDAFWLTRPVSWRTLLLSKSILIGAVFVVIPVLFDAVMMAGFRVRLTDVALISLSSMLLRAMLVAFLMTLAALTKTLTGFALVAGGLLMSLAVLANMSLVVAMRSLREAPEINDVSARVGDHPSVSILVMVSLTAALAVFVAVQYRTRSRLAAISTGVLGVVVAIALPFVWPWSYRVIAAPAWADRESALRLVAPASTIEFRPREDWVPSHRPAEWFAGTLRLRLSGTERTWLGTLRLRDGRLTFDDGSELVTVGNGDGMTVAFEGVDDLPDDAIARDVMGVSRLWPVRWDPQYPLEAVPALVVSEAALRNRLGTAARYRGSFMLDLDQLQIAGTVPLVPGAEFHGNGQRLVIEGALLRRDSAQLRVRRITTTTTLQGRPWLLFYLRNARTSEAVAGFDRPEDLPTASGSWLPLFGVGGASAEGAGFSVDRRIIEFSGGLANQRGFVMTSDWLAQSELVILQRVQHGSVARTVEIPRVEIVEAPRPPTTR